MRRIKWTSQTGSPPFPIENEKIADVCGED
jgi:hypothetical protein